VIGIGLVLFLLALFAAWFNRRLTDAGDPADLTDHTADTNAGTFAET
jgi:hypothetical protein